VNLIAELKRLKGDLEDSLEKKKPIAISGVHIWPRLIVVSSSGLAPRLKNSKS
jgi:hypothetical protein